MKKLKKHTPKKVPAPPAGKPKKTQEISYLRCYFHTLVALLIIFVMSLCVTRADAYIRDHSFTSQSYIFEQLKQVEHAHVFFFGITIIILIADLIWIRIKITKRK